MITLTDIATNKVKSQLEKRGRGVGIKIGVRTTGCSGLAYTIEFVDEPTPELVQTTDQVWLEPKAIPYIQGSTLDWRKQGLNEGFEFINPNEASRCGCGESFNV